MWSYIHPLPIRLHGVVLKQLSTGTTLPYLTFYRQSSSEIFTNIAMFQFLPSCPNKTVTHQKLCWNSYINPVAIYDSSFSFELGTLDSAVGQQFHLAPLVKTPTIEQQ
jgi:hypothetical protein